MGTVLLMIISEWCVWGWVLSFLSSQGNLQIGKSLSHANCDSVGPLVKLLQCLCSGEHCLLNCKMSSFTIMNNFTSVRMHQKVPKKIGSFPQAVFCLLSVPHPPWARVIMK